MDSAHSDPLLTHKLIFSNTPPREKGKIKYYGSEYCVSCFMNSKHSTEYCIVEISSFDVIISC